MCEEVGIVTSDFFKFPTTPHLAVLLGVEVRDDKIFSQPEQHAFLQNELIIEEKVDGANLGISFDSEGNLRVQNRGAYLQLSSVGQWKKLEQWIEPHTDVLFDTLTNRYILFGEWCYAQHSVFYNKLPDWFLGFDIFDKQVGKFFSVKRRDKIFIKAGIKPVPNIAYGYFSYIELQHLLSTSQLGNQLAEGVYMRFDEGDWLRQRAKLVRAAFIQSIDQHWSREGIKPNCLSFEQIEETK